MFGVCGLAVQTVILRYMLKWVGEKRVLVVGLCAACLEMVVVAFLTAKWQVQSVTSRCHVFSIVCLVVCCHGD